MVSSQHEALHRVFQEESGLVTRALRMLHIPFGDPTSITELATDLTENRPLERRVDSLLKMETAKGTFLVAIEAQGKKDPDKPANWAYYLAHLYAKYKLPPLLLVLCKDRSTAAWASSPVNIGPPEWPALTLRPLVLGPDEVPVIQDAAEAAKDIQMAVLSAMVHSRDQDVDVILKALSVALKGLEVSDPEAAMKYVELTAQGLGDKTRAAEIWRNLVAVDTSFFTSPLSEEIRDEGRDEGRTEGRTEGHIQRQAEDILRILDRRTIPLTDADRERVTSCKDLGTLTRWFDRAITATSAAEIFADDEPGDEER
ncbi:hypothetical protein AB0N14_21615 [Streptomyces sp. NPDC051104]|uniref:hypothetical protein n=1 Tax=Streptomyces sp. NPDC051104 TaxID=3155044 RepID=UPI00341B26B5